VLDVRSWIHGLAASASIPTDCIDIDDEKTDINKTYCCT